MHIKESNNDLLIVAGALYVVVIFIGVNSSSTLELVVDVERTVFYRERVAGMYFALPYVLAQVSLISLFHFILDIQTLHLPNIFQAQ